MIEPLPRHTCECRDGSQFSLFVHNQISYSGILKASNDRKTSQRVWVQSVSGTTGPSFKMLHLFLGKKK